MREAELAGTNAHGSTSDARTYKDAAAIIVAAGSGNRFGGPKQFEMLEGEALFQHVVRTFAEVPCIQLIVVVGRAEDTSALEQGIAALGLSIECRVVPGGETRQQSVARGLGVVRRNTATEVVLVHDVARVLVDRDTIERVVDEARTHGAAIAGIPVVDSMKRVIAGEIVETVSRENLWRAQTPQAARLPLLVAAFAQAESSQYEGKDESELLERIGEKPRIVPGSEDNFKITYPEDIGRARAILRKRNSA